MRPAPSRGLIILAGTLAAMLALVLFRMAATEWQEFRMPQDMGLDLAWFNQGLYSGLHGHWRLDSTVVSLVAENYNHAVLEGHFSPVYYLFLPFYALWPSPLLLLLIAACGVAACGFAGTLIAARVLGSAAVALVWFGLYALHPTIAWSVVADGFHEPFVAMGFLGLALLFYIEERYCLFFLMVVLAIASKEDVALVLPVWGVVAGLQRRGRRLVGALILLGVGYFVAVNFVILPLIRGERVGHVVFNALTSPLGYTPQGIMDSILYAPGDIVRLVASSRNLSYWAAIFSPLLFLPLLGWDYLVIPAFIFLEISMAPRLQHIPMRHVCTAIPFIFVAGMVGTSRLIRFFERAGHRLPAREVLVRTVSLGAVLCGLTASTIHSTPLPALLRQNWPAATSLKEDASLMHALASIPPAASVAATWSLVGQIAARNRLYFLGGAEFYDRHGAQAGEWGPDYLAFARSDLDALPAFRRIRALLCQGTYGVVYADGARSGRLLMEWGAGRTMNRVAYETLYAPLMRERSGDPPASLQEDCPVDVQDQEAISPQIFTKAAGLHVRTHVPSEVGVDNMFPEPAVALSHTRFFQVIHLPDHTFGPGRYRLTLTGAWPWWGAPASDRMMARVRVGARTVGEVTIRGDQLLSYTTPPFRVDDRARLPIQVRVELEVPHGLDGLAFQAFRPARNGCAIVADSPSLNPRQVTVEALVYQGTMPLHAGREVELPILTKNSAPGYYLRIVGDSQGKVWVDFNVAWKWALGRVGVGTMPFHQWTAITATYNGQEAAIYINGRRAPQDPSRSPRYAGPIRSQGAPLVIGCRDPGKPYEAVFPGLIASVRVWDRVLTSQEILDNATAWPALMSNRGLVGDWRFETVDGGLVPDLSSAKNPITNGTQLARVSAPGAAQMFAAWRSRELNVLRLVTVRRVAP